MAAGQTVVFYNGVTIRNCRTLQFEQTEQFDESDTDLIFYRFTVRVEGYIHGRAPVSVIGTEPITGATGDAAQTQRGIRYLLMEPRGPFEMRTGMAIEGGSLTGGTILLKASPVPSNANSESFSGFDLNNGPRCLTHSIDHVVANELFRVSATFEVCVLECNAEGTSPNNTSGVLSNRWSCQDEIDQNFYTTRTYTGVLRTFSGRINPHQFRHYVVPPLEPGLRRERMDFEATADGLSLRYTVVDKEVAFAAPAPATDWNYRYTEMTGDGMNQYGEVQITLEGDRNCNKKDLIALAAAFIESKLVALAGNVNANPQQFFEYLSFTDEGGSTQYNRITASARVRRANKKGVVQDINIATARLGAAITPANFAGAVIQAAAVYDANRSRGGRQGESPEVEGPVGMAGLFLCYLQSPCGNAHKIAEAGTSERSPRAGTGGEIQVSARISSSISDAPPEYLSSSHNQAIYTYWQLESMHDFNAGTVGLPVAGGAEQSSELSSNRDSVSVVSIHRKVCYRTVRVKGERIGAWPRLPDPEDYTDSNGIKASLLSHKVMPATTERTPDGQRLFRASAEFTFALSRAPTPQEELRVGENPWDVLGTQSTAALFSDSQNLRSIG